MATAPNSVVFLQRSQSFNDPLTGALIYCDFRRSLFTLSHWPSFVHRSEQLGLEITQSRTHLTMVAPAVGKLVVALLAETLTHTHDHLFLPAQVAFFGLSDTLNCGRPCRRFLCGVTQRPSSFNDTRTAVRCPACDKGQDAMEQILRPLSVAGQPDA